jgi:hypothetical protein
VQAPALLSSSVEVTWRRRRRRRRRNLFVELVGLLAELVVEQRSESP